MNNKTRVDQIAALVAQARQYTEPLRPEPPSPTLLQRFTEFLGESPISLPKIAKAIAAFGTLTCGVTIGLGIAGIVTGIFSLGASIAVLAVGLLLIGIVYLFSRVILESRDFQDVNGLCS